MDLMTEAAGDALHPTLAEDVTHGPSALGIAAGPALPWRHRRLELLDGAMAVDAPVLAARSRDGQAALLIATRGGAVNAAEDASAVGTVLIAADLLFDEALEGVEERALHRVRHHRAAPLGGLARVADSAVGRGGLRRGDRRLLRDSHRSRFLSRGREEGERSEGHGPAGADGPDAVEPGFTARRAGSTPPLGRWLLRGASLARAP